VLAPVTQSKPLSHHIAFGTKFTTNTDAHSGHAACGNHYTPSMTTITIMEHDLHAMSLSGRKSLTRSGVIGSSAFLN
ncbi:MAG: hypothetical protein KAI21_03360, partial [Deltaproteobacteria bacterium]|nr:hypothetical protein [Deltaproteobacteria bacterium]